MKKSTLLILLLLTFSFGFGQTNLVAGEVAITGANANNPDQFSFVLLTDVTNGTIINFTDAGWTAAGAFRNINTGTGVIANEGIVTWTATSDLDCGTEIIIEETSAGSNVYTATSGTATETDNGFAIVGNGDQIIAFQGTTLSPNFLFALHFADGLGWAADATTNQTSTVPTGLTDGVNAVAITQTQNNIIYNYTTFGDNVAILAAIVDPLEWTASSSILVLGLPSDTSFSCDTIINTNLMAGEIAITGANADNSDEFSFVLLTDVINGTKINFTDAGWTSGGAFRGINTGTGVIANEGVVTWVADSDLPCGTEIIIEDLGSNVYSATSGTATETDGGFAIASAGDQIIAFQGSTLSPNFLFALHFADGLGWAADATSNATSTVPTGLTDGVNAVDIPLNADNIIYNYTTLGDNSAILAAIVDSSEWLGSASRQILGLPSGASFSCDTIIVTTSLMAGEIAITGANADNPDEFSFVLLTDVSNGTRINFTDGGWTAAGEFRGLNAGVIDEGIVTWTADSDLLCGTEIIIAETSAGSNVYTATSGTASETDTGFAFTNNNGDQLIAFQGNTISPTFLYALHFGNDTGFTDAIDANTSAVPAGLTEGINAVAIDLDNLVYDYSVIDGQNLILTATVDSSNWSGNNGTRQSLGLPLGVSFDCTTPGTCGGGTVTWSGGSWFGGTPDISTNVVIATSYNTGTDGSFNCCTLTINATTGSLTVSDNTLIVVENDVAVNGDLIVETSGSFVQNGVGASAGTFTGTATLNKTTPVKTEWYYYTYWSSPVTSETIGNIFPNVNSDWKYSFNAANFVDTDFDDIDDDGNDWEVADDVDTMTPGVGYAVAGESSSAGSYPRADNLSFTGAFNTGNITIPITYGAANTSMRWNFIGNPYPSAIDFVAFHLANSSVLEGAAYFWSQASPPNAANPGNDTENFSQNDYAVFTIGTGGTAGAGPGTPNGYVASGQGFFIPALASLPNPIGNSVTFTNAMRVPDNTSNSQFFKGSSSKKSNANTINPLENRLWINLTTDNGVFNQILVGYVDNATDDYDGMSYDAPKILNSGFAAALYSTIDNDDNRYAVQGKAMNSINEDEIIKLGFISTISSDTQFKFSIEQFEGSFLNDNTIYIKDNLLDLIHDLTNSDYAFTSEVGEFNSRFEIVFNAQALSTEDTILDSNALKIVQLDNDNVSFTVSDNLNIKSVSIFDLLGRQLYNLKGNSNSETYSLSNLQDAIYIAKVELSNGAVITKKALKK